MSGISLFKGKTIYNEYNLWTCEGTTESLKNVFSFRCFSLILCSGFVLRLYLQLSFLQVVTLIFASQQFHEEPIRLVVR